MNSFSFFDRENTFKELTSKEFDELIVGGGITGAGIALDAATRGMSVALVEKNDFASGTSSKSTKLIHGGLRYVKQFDFWLVKDGKFSENFVMVDNYSVLKQMGLSFS